MPLTREDWLWILVSCLAGLLVVEFAILVSDPLIAGSPTEVTVPIIDKLDEQSWLGLAGR